jgi:hypothetical protein
MKNLIYITFLAFSFSQFSIAGQPNHDNWSNLLKKYVSSEGKVNYKGFKKEESKVDDYIADLKKNDIESSWSSNEKKAYWINAYNAFTIKLILTKYPLKSITDLKFDGKSAWDYKWIELGGSKLSLNDIEKTKLIKGFGDARVHFLINCASFSCPILINKAITSSNVESLLSSQTKKFFSDKSRNKISEDKIEVSEIFKWYKDDFGNVIDFINKYSSVKVKSDASISYMNYNWNLNE